MLFAYECKWSSRNRVKAPSDFKRNFLDMALWIFIMMQKYYVLNLNIHIICF